jgi:hypothetical protein
MADEETYEYGPENSPTYKMKGPPKGPAKRLPGFLQPGTQWGPARGIKASRPGKNQHDFNYPAARTQADAWNEARTGRSRYPKGNSDIDPGFTMPNNDASNDTGFTLPNNDISNDKGFYRGPDDDDNYDDRL